IPIVSFSACYCCCADCRPHSFPTRRSSDLPTTRGSRYAAPMSPPDRPTLVNRNANRPLVETTRKSEASATTAPAPAATPWMEERSEEHTSELQSRFDLVCRLLLEKKNRIVC